MRSETRLALFFALTIGSILAVQKLLDVTGLAPPPPKKPEAAAVANDDAKPDAADDQAAAKPKDWPDLPTSVFQPPPPEGGAVEAVEPSRLVLGSDEDKRPDGYRLRVDLEQNGAGVAEVSSSRYEAEFVGKNPHRPLRLIHRDPQAPPSLAVSLVVAGADRDAPLSEIPLDQTLWRVKKADGRYVQTIPPQAASDSEEQGRAIAFETAVADQGVTLTKTYRLMKGADGFEMDLTIATIEGLDKERSVVYKLIGPHGIPIEGESYTGTFRDAVFGQVEANGAVKVVTKSAQEIVKAKDSPVSYQSLPLKLAGIENQYFAVFVEPDHKPITQENRWDAEAVGIVLHDDPKEPAATQKAAIAVQITSKPVVVEPNIPVTHAYKVFAGPKTAAALRPYEAVALSTYRKSAWFVIPGSSEVAGVISPLLDYIYEFTRKVAALLGGKTGNYGVSIILLTMLIRSLMFPLSRKQAIAAKKMQDLQPLLKEIQAKYKDDKERQTKETFALYKKHGVNPVGGCLPALIQLPIFVGLWQALNTSVRLRHASFLYIQDLAAPDMLFPFPWGETPYIGKYFNLLPLLVVGLMLVQTKLFAPPATTPEAEMQQKMMKYMMVFMAFMFYKVPSGLGIYFITSSLWQVCERLLLPKMAAAHAAKVAEEGDDNPGPGGGGGNGPPAPPKPPGRFSQFMERVLDEAKKDSTYRKLIDAKNPPPGPDKNKDRDRRDDRRDRGKPRARPGKRR